MIGFINTSFTIWLIDNQLQQLTIDDCLRLAQFWLDYDRLLLSSPGFCLLLLLTWFRVRVRVTLRLAVYRQSLRLGAKPLETEGQNFFQLNTCGHSPYVTSSMTREWVCRLQLLLALAIAVILRSESRGTHDHILLPQIRDSPNLEGQVSMFISPSNRVARLYPQAMGSLFIASYDSQGYGGGIRTRLHTG
jgi:hypothetical protein